MRKQLNLDNVLSDVEFDALNQNLENILTDLGKYSVNLTQEERKSARNVSSKREAYVRATLRAAKDHEDFLPRDIDVSVFEQSLSLFEQQLKLMGKLNKITEMIEDTKVAIGQELMYYTDSIYVALQAARKREAMVDRTLIELEGFNKRSKQDDSPVDDNNDNDDNNA